MRIRHGGAIAATVCGLLMMGIWAPRARAGLIYESGATPLIYDTATGDLWTQDGNISGQTFTYQDAQAWAQGLTLDGFSWMLPTAADFTSLYTDLAPYGAPGSPGAQYKYGSSVSFGTGPNDYAANVQTVYWTQTENVDFNFFYGYGGFSADSNTFAAWAIRTPEPSPAWLLLAGALPMLLSRRRRSGVNCIVWRGPKNPKTISRR